MFGIHGENNIQIYNLTSAEPTSTILFSSHSIVPSIQVRTISASISADLTSMEPISTVPFSLEPTSEMPISAEPSSAEPSSAEPTSAEPTSAEPTSAAPN